jgi:glycosyltransferase involved in cell wall biosynthesis
MNITAIILTLNESIHLQRCLESIKDVANNIVVVDCFSTDNTLDIARSFAAVIVQREWTNHADQFNWALSQLPENTEWVLRIDADEYLTPELATEIKQKMPAISPGTNGIYLNRRMAFQHKLIHHGGVFPISILRLFRYGYGQCENRLMDEHIKVSGPTTKFSEEMIDDNLNSLSWWTEKHNKYSSLEAVELLNLEFHFMQIESIATLKGGKQASVKRWLKERVYVRLPSGFRAFAYFFYRYFVRFGFLDGYQGTSFHFLQGFWYRYLVDAKVVEVKRYMDSNKVDAKTAINTVLGIML